MSAPTIDGLREALEAMVNDHMTSETHHPRHVLVPIDAFERARSLLTPTEDHPISSDVVMDAGNEAYRQGYRDGFVDALYPGGFDGDDEREVWKRIDGAALAEGWQNYADTFRAIVEGKQDA